MVAKGLDVDKLQGHHEILDWWPQRRPCFLFFGEGPPRLDCCIQQAEVNSLQLHAAKALLCQLVS